MANGDQELYRKREGRGQQCLNVPELCVLYVIRETYGRNIEESQCMYIDPSVRRG